MWYEEPLIDPRCEAYVIEHNITKFTAKELDWHVEAIHGWEPHDKGYEEAIVQSAACLLEGGNCYDDSD